MGETPQCFNDTKSGTPPTYLRDVILIIFVRVEYGFDNCTLEDLIKMELQFESVLNISKMS